MAKVELGGNEITVQDLSGRKAIRATKIIRSMAQAWPEILKEIASFTRTYEEDNVVELDRAEARARYHARPLLDPETGQPLRDGDGQLVYGPDPLGHLTDEDWEKSGNKYRIRKSPSQGEIIAGVFPMAFDVAEEQLSQLLALGVIRNEDLDKVHGEEGPEGITKALKEKADELLSYDLGDLIELAVVISEVVDEQLRSRLDRLGRRTGKLLKLVGLGSTSKASETPTPSTSIPPSPTSSTSSPELTDGESGEPSIERDGSDLSTSAIA